MQITDQNKQNKGFVAGTLIHTDKGLLPIEQLKAGDRVLSKPENDPNAPNEYKIVIHTFKSRIKLFYVTYAVQDIDGDYKAKLIFCGENQTVWAKSWSDCDIEEHEKYIDLGWHPVLPLNASDGHAFETCSHIPLIVADVRSGDDKDICVTEENPLIAILYDDGSNIAVVDFRVLHPVIVGEANDVGMRSLASTQTKRILASDKNNPDLKYFNSLRTTFEPYYADVYQIEVEDHHTYFIGNEGIWVHQ